MKNTLGLLFVWLLTGFTLGTSTLAGPVRWLTRVGREQGWSEGNEALLVRGVIVGLVLVSFLIALRLNRIAMRTERTHVRIGIWSVILLTAGSSVWLWMNPTLMGRQADEADEHVGASFTFGPYPSPEKLAELKRLGYTGVISLLHPAVVPFEPKLIADGREAADKVGLEYVHAPMLPWVSENRESLDRIEQRVRQQSGRYYVHCYLGKDRIRVVQRVVAEVDPTAAVEAESQVEMHIASRQLRDGLALERGMVVEVTEGVFLIPYPTDNEFVSYVVPGDHGPVVSLLDPDNPEDLPWIERERKLIEGNRLQFFLRPISINPFDPQRALEVAREVALMPRPLLVHAFLSVESGRSPAAEGFLQAFRANVPPLPRTVVSEMASQSHLPIRGVAPNVAVGPRPAGPQFGSVLARRGIRQFAYLGPADDAAAREDATICRDAGLDWQALDPSAGLDALHEGGPWYAYGPGLDAGEPLLVAAGGPPLPDAMRWDPLASRDPIATAGLARILQAIPDARTIILAAPPLLLYVFLAASLVGWLRQRRELAAPYTRKIFHFMIFTTASLLHLTGGLPLVTLFGALVASAVLYAVYRGDDFGFYEAMARPTDRPRRSLFILIPLLTTAVGGMASALLFGAFALVGYLVAGWGDAIAEPVGTAWGRHRYRVPSLAGVAATRSIEGSLAVMIFGSLAAALGLWLSGIPAPTAFGIGLACGLAGTLLEAISNHGLDNLTVQLAASGTAWLLLAGA